MFISFVMRETIDRPIPAPFVSEMNSIPCPLSLMNRYVKPFLSTKPIPTYWPDLAYLITFWIRLSNMHRKENRESQVILHTYVG